MFREESRLDRARQIKDTVMRVNENTFCVPSQNRRGKAHIITIEDDILSIEIPSDIPIEAQDILDISNCSQRYKEFINRSKDLLHRLTLYPPKIEKIYSCSCEDRKFHPDMDCKHILAVKLNQKEVI